MRFGSKSMAGDRVAPSGPVVAGCHGRLPWDQTCIEKSVPGRTLPLELGEEEGAA